MWCRRLLWRSVSLPLVSMRSWHATTPLEDVPQNGTGKARQNVSAPPGWYPDPEGRPQCSRHFDGTAWTNQYQRSTDGARSRWRRFAAALQWIVASVVLLGAASVFFVAGVRTI